MTWWPIFLKPHRATAPKPDGALTKAIANTRSSIRIRQAITQSSFTEHSGVLFAFSIQGGLETALAHRLC
jgi:hypothetical protein